MSSTPRDDDDDDEDDDDDDDDDDDFDHRRIHAVKCEAPVKWPKPEPARGWSLSPSAEIFSIILCAFWCIFAHCL